MSGPGASPGFGTTGDGTGEHDFTAAWLMRFAPVVLALVVIGGGVIQVVDPADVPLDKW